jgi:hypothetical protein
MIHASPNVSRGVHLHEPRGGMSSSESNVLPQFWLIHSKRLWGCNMHSEIYLKLLNRRFSMASLIHIQSCYNGKRTRHHDKRPAGWWVCTAIEHQAREFVAMVTDFPNHSIQYFRRRDTKFLNIQGETAVAIFRFLRHRLFLTVCTRFLSWPSPPIT